MFTPYSIQVISWTEFLITIIGHIILNWGNYGLVLGCYTPKMHQLTWFNGSKLQKSRIPRQVGQPIGTFNGLTLRHTIMQPVLDGSIKTWQHFYCIISIYFGPNYNSNHTHFFHVPLFYMHSYITSWSIHIKVLDLAHTIHSHILT